MVTHGVVFRAIIILETLGSKSETHYTPLFIKWRALLEAVMKNNLPFSIKYR